MFYGISQHRTEISLFSHTIFQRFRQIAITRRFSAITHLICLLTEIIIGIMRCYRLIFE